MSSCVLGLDGGGTQTRVAAAGCSGSIIGTGVAGACNLAAVSPADALAAALAAADAALHQAGQERTDVVAVCAGVAGVSYFERRLLFMRGLQTAFPDANVAVEADFVIAYTGATGGQPGVIVIAGTGSAAYGENAIGETHRTGAYGYLIDDSGSSYGLGRGALAAVLQAADGTGPLTSLSKRVPEVLGIKFSADIVPAVYGGALSRVAIAGLSRVVADAATEDEDAVARALLQRAGGTLAHLTHGVTQRLFADQAAPFPVVQIGGLWNAGDALTDVFVRSLRRFAPPAVITPPLSPPVEGAVQRALTQIGVPQKTSSPS